MSFDSRSSALLRMIYPDIAVRAVRLEQDMLRIHGLQLRVTEAVRTMEYQTSLYARGRQFHPINGAPLEPGVIPVKNVAGVWQVVDRRLVVTNSPAGLSLHHFGMAVDCCFVGSDPYLEKLPQDKREFFWAEYGRLAEAHGLEWGGHFKTICDRPHVQLSYGFRVQEIRGFYQSGGMEGVWRAIDKHRGLPEGQEWQGPLAKQKLLEIGLLA